MLTICCKMKQKMPAVKRTRKEALSPGWGGEWQWEYVFWEEMLTGAGGPGGLPERDSVVLNCKNGLR